MNAQEASKKLIEVLKNGKEKSKATYEELASQAGCNVDAIKNIFAGKTSCANFLLICEIFRKMGISLDEFAEIPLRVDTRSHVDSIAFTATLDTVKEMNARTDASHRDTVNLLQRSIANLQTALTEARQRWELREKKLNAKNMRISIALYAIILALIILTIADFLNPTIGWWREHIADAAIQITKVFRRG